MKRCAQDPRVTDSVEGPRSRSSWIDPKRPHRAIAAAVGGHYVASSRDSGVEREQVAAARRSDPNQRPTTTIGRSRSSSPRFVDRSGAQDPLDFSNSPVQLSPGSELRAAATASRLVNRECHLAENRRFAGAAERAPRGMCRSSPFGSMREGVVADWASTATGNSRPTRSHRRPPITPRPIGLCDGAIVRPPRRIGGRHATRRDFERLADGPDQLSLSL